MKTIDIVTLKAQVLNLKAEVNKTRGGGFNIMVKHPYESCFFHCKSEIKTMFAKDYCIHILGNNHINLTKGTGFRSVL